MTCKDCVWEKSCVYADIDVKEICYKFKLKESEDADVDESGTNQTPAAIRQVQ
jgi:hypothetical protein